MLVYGGLSVLSRCSALLTAPLLTTILTVGEYGIVDTLNATIAIASLLVGLNLDSGVFRLYYEKDEHQRGALLTTTLLLYVSASGLLAVFVFIGKESVSQWIFGDSQFASLVALSIIRFPFLLAFQQGCSLLRMLGKPYAFSAFNLALTLGNVCVVVALYLTDGLQIAPLIGWFSALQVVITFALMVYVRSYYHGRFSTPLLRELLHYALPQMPSLLINFLIMGSMPFLITRLSSTHDTGLFSLAQRLAQLFGILVFAFRTAYDPLMMRLMAEQPLETFRDASRESFRFYCTLLAPLALFVSIVPIAFPYIIHEKFSQALLILPLLTLANFLMGLQNILGLGIAYSKRTKYLSYAQGWAAGLFFLLAYPLIGNYGFQGAALLVLMATSMQVLAVLFYSQRLLSIPYPMIGATLAVALTLSTFFLPPIFQWTAVLLIGGFAIKEWRHNRFWLQITNA